MSYLSDLLGSAYKEGMTEEEINAALEKSGVSVPKANNEQKFKEAFNKASAEAAKYKKELEAHLTDEQKKEVERQAEFEKLENENKQLKRDASVSSFKSKYVAMGYDEKLAQSTAEAMADGDTDTVFANQAKFNKTQAETIKADLIRKTPEPAKDGKPEVMTLDTLRKMSTKDRIAYANEHPEEYKQLYEEG